MVGVWADPVTAQVTITFLACRIRCARSRRALRRRPGWCYEPSRQVTRPQYYAHALKIMDGARMEAPCEGTATRPQCRRRMLRGVTPKRRLKARQKFEA